MKTTTRIGQQHCPHCGKPVNRSTMHNGDGLPIAGDVSICAWCSFASIFGDDMTLRMPTPEEKQEIADSKECQAAINAVLDEMFQQANICIS